MVPPLSAYRYSRASEIPTERLAIDDLPPIEQVQIVEVPVLDTTEIVVQKPAEPRQAAITPDPVPLPQR